MSSDPDPDRLPCGCTDYHFADCPILTNRYTSYDDLDHEDDYDWKDFYPDGEFDEEEDS